MAVGATPRSCYPAVVGLSIRSDGGEPSLALLTAVAVKRREMPNTFSISALSSSERTAIIRTSINCGFAEIFLIPGRPTRISGLVFRQGERSLLPKVFGGMVFARRLLYAPAFTTVGLDWVGLGAPKKTALQWLFMARRDPDGIFVSISQRRT